MLGSRDLGTILRGYRRFHGLSQEQLAEILGYDKTYLSLIENHRRTIGDVAALRGIARALALPAHVLGVTDSTDADFRAMLQFGDSTIRLAEIARQSGAAVEAVNELWPLVARLEARATESHLDRDTLMLLGQARLALGVSLGTVLPEERLSMAARWTGKALALAQRIEDKPFLTQALSMHGNELRKADHTSASVARLNQAVTVAEEPEQRGTALAFLARATGELGIPERFDRAITAYRRQLEQRKSSGMLVNPFTLHEIHLRGLISTGRGAEAAKRAQSTAPTATSAGPQWSVIERVTAGHALLAAHDHSAATDVLRHCLDSAERHHLPHQIQRIIRIAYEADSNELATAASAALRRLTATSLSR